MEDIFGSALQDLLSTGPIGGVLVLSLLGLIWMTKTLLSSKDKEIEDKNSIIKGKEEDIKQLIKADSEKDQRFFEFLASLSTTLDKNTDLFDRHDQDAKRHREGSRRYREKMISEVESFKRTLDFIKNK